MNKLEIGRVYKHFKGDSYIVLDTGIYSETNEECVIYKALYDNGETFIRPKEMFLSKVDKNKYPEVLQEYRFELQDIERINK